MRVRDHLQVSGTCEPHGSTSREHEHEYITGMNDDCDQRPWFNTWRSYLSLQSLMGSLLVFVVLDAFARTPRVFSISFNCAVLVPLGVEVQVRCLQQYHEHVPKGPEG